MTTTTPKTPSIDTQKVLKAAASIGALGTGPRSAPRIMAALCDPDVRPAEVTALVGKEPAMSARVLRVANSAYYGQSRGVTSLTRALGLLGLDAVRGIAAASCLDRMAQHSEGALVNMEALVAHSQATAAAAELLAQEVHPALAPDAFLAGLLHNLGTAVQLSLDNAGVRGVLDLRRQGATRTIRELEAQVPVIGHEECGAILFEAWQLPESVITATRHHHDPLGAPQPQLKLTALVHLGANLALAAGCTFVLDPAAVATGAPVLDCLGLTQDQLDAVAAALPGRLELLRQTVLSV